MNKFIDPELYNLPSTTKLEQIGTNQFEIVVERKSRIIMKDGQTLLTKVNKIKDRVPQAKVGLRTTAPICSKTKLFLEEHDVMIKMID